MSGISTNDIDAPIVAALEDLVVEDKPVEIPYDPAILRYFLSLIFNFI